MTVDKGWFGNDIEIISETNEIEEPSAEDDIIDDDMLVEYDVPAENDEEESEIVEEEADAE